MWLVPREKRYLRCDSGTDPMHHLDPNLQTRGQADAPSGGVESQPSPVDPLHHLDRNLQMRGKAENPFKSRRPGATDVVRIALTGGPCAGKSSALEKIIEHAKKEGFDVYTAPEVATLIWNSGVNFPQNDHQVYTFQLGLARIQLQMERSFTKIVQATGRPAIIIFDRGLLDGKCYMPDEMWDEIMQKFGGGDEEDHITGVSTEYIHARYDAVVHMVTAADGASQHYRWGNVHDDSGNAVVRWEPPEDAIKLDNRMKECWYGHPNHIIVDNSNKDGFEGKLVRVSTAVLDTAKRKVKKA